MKLISCFQDGQLKILMEVIGVDNSPPNAKGGGGKSSQHKQIFITLKKGLWLYLESHMI